jgi:hypothetical protein
MLTALGLRGAIRGHNGSQALLVDETGGPFLAIHINPPQQADQGLEAPRFLPEEGLCPCVIEDWIRKTLFWSF